LKPTAFAPISGDGVVFVLHVGLWSAAAVLGNGWCWLDWFGYFCTTYDPWIFHLEHGWMYCVGTDVSSLWLWTPDVGWLWTGSATYP